MSKNDTNAGGSSTIDDLWDGGSNGQSDVHDAIDPEFDNSEARSVVDESMVDDAQFAPVGEESAAAPAKKKGSNLAFYAVVGVFAVGAAGLLGFKAGLFGRASKAPLEPITLAQGPSGTSGAPAKTESLLSGGSADPLSGSKSAAKVSDMESDLFGERAATSSTAPAAVPAAESPAPAVKVDPPVQVAQAVPAAPAAPAAVEKPAAVQPPVEAVREPQKKVEVVAATAADPKPAKVSKTRAARNAPVVIGKKAAVKPTEVVARRAKHRTVVVARASKGKAARVAKDPRPDAPEIMAGWSLRGTWPSQGPSQRAWIADEQGRVTTVSVGQYVSGAKVLSIGKRGEVVLTTAGQIVP